ncbi:helix-turn-helix transcriptional regulator [Streptosporangium sp. NPDC000563]|uniref:helix-turn-helix transcriptional regulator n=1 Tax=Streptosporangium sp. NPDC000563 TaxID=3154366 RepID=UPI003333684A
MNDLPVWAVRLREERQSREWSLKDMARRLIDAAGGRTREHLPTQESLTRMVRAWEAGKHRPNEPYPALLAQIFEVPERELFANPPNADELVMPSEGIFIRKAPDGDDMERRRLLQIAAASAGIGIFGVSGEPVRQLLELSLDHGFRSGEEWEISAADHLHALRTRPPAQVAADLIIDLLTVRRQMEVSSPAEVTELQRTLAVLASIHANALTRLGDHGAAVRWWRTGRSAADASGDREVRLLVRSEEAGHGLYGQRAPETVMRLVGNAEQVAGGLSVDLLTTRAKALSLLGRHAEARETLDAVVELTEKGDRGDSLGFWKENQIYFTQSWVHAGAGDEARAGTARENVLRLTCNYQYQANIALHEALCTVVQGATDEGVRRAATVIDPLPVAYRSNHIIETGRMLLRAIPLDQQDRPAVGEFREVLSTKVAT